jgi:hypothetical protein
MKYLKKFNEYYTSPGDMNFLSGNNVSFGSKPNMGGVSSSSAAGTPGKNASPAGKDSFGPHIENYDKVLKTLKGPKSKVKMRKKHKKSKKRKNIFNKRSKKQ